METQIVLVEADIAESIRQLLITRGVQFQGTIECEFRADVRQGGGDLSNLRCIVSAEGIEAVRGSDQITSTSPKA